MRNAIGNIIILVLLAGVGYVFREPIAGGWHLIFAKIAPCKQPVQYSIGTFDDRFDISRVEFESAVKEAESLWERAIGKDLFAYATGTGALKVNLVYDYRQEATEKMRKLGLAVDDSRSSYDALKAKYDSLERQYATRKAAFETRRKKFETDNAAHSKEVQSWNAKGGAPQPQFDQLKAEEARLQTEFRALQTEQNALNGMVADINALVVVINQIANNINLNADAFNAIGKERGQEFEEGIYEIDGTSQKIDIYQFNDRQKLVRVLAHELGHALGLQHVEDQKAIMYRLNQSTNMVPTAADLQEVNSVCGFK